MQHTIIKLMPMYTHLKKTKKLTILNLYRKPKRLGLNIWEKKKSHFTQKAFLHPETCIHTAFWEIYTFSISHIQPQEFLLKLKPLFPSSTDLVRARFLSCISVQTTQVLQNRHSADSTDSGQICWATLAENLQPQKLAVLYLFFSTLLPKDLSQL